MIPAIPKRSWRNLSPEARTALITSTSGDHTHHTTTIDHKTTLALACWLGLCLNETDTQSFTGEDGRCWCFDPLRYINKFTMYLVDDDLEKLDFHISRIIPYITDYGRKEFIDTLNKLELVMAGSRLRTKEVYAGRGEDGDAFIAYNLLMILSKHRQTFWRYSENYGGRDFKMLDYAREIFISAMNSSYLKPSFK